MIDATLRRRLLACLGLLASDRDGEALAAARGAVRTLQAAGLIWDQVVVGSEPNGEEDDPAGWLADLALAGRHADALSGWERAFIAGVARVASPSAKQRDRLTQIAAALRAEGCR